MPTSKRRLLQAFGETVRSARLKAEMTQEQLSFRAAVHRTYVSDLERGLKSPTLDVIAALAEALGTMPHTLVEEATRSRQKASHASERRRFRSPGRPSSK